MQRFFEGKKWVLAVAIVLVGAYARAQGTKDTLTLNLAKAIEIALSDNPTIKVAEEEIALKKVSHKETWQNVARSEHFGKYEPHYYGAAVQYRRPDCENG